LLDGSRTGRRGGGGGRRWVGQRIDVECIRAAAVFGGGADAGHVAGAGGELRGHGRVERGAAVALRAVFDAEVRV